MFRIFNILRVDPHVTLQFLTGDAAKMVDTAGILSVCDPVHVVLIKNDPSGETTIVTSHFLEWRPVMSAPNSRCTMTVELMGVGMRLLTSKVYSTKTCRFGLQ